MSNYNAIDLAKVKELVLEYCAIEDSKTFILEEEVDFNPLVIKNNLKQTREALELLNDNFSVSFDGIENLNEVFEKAEKDIPLNGVELSKILAFHNHCKRVKTKIGSIDKDLSIKDYADSVYVNDSLAARIDKVVDYNGNIKEDASPELASIFRRINRNSNNIRSASASFIAKNAAYLQENSSFDRNDRTAFLLKNSAKNKFNGYQYGTSASGLATYVEPEQFIELNNEKLSLENEKLEEVNRILKELTAYVSYDSESYILNFESLMKLDVVFAKAEYGYYKAGIIADINEDKTLFIKDIAHPLIDPKTVVTNTYSLHEPYQGIVISGTNTGGKTVGLKLIGLSVLMSYLGIPVLATQASIPLFNEVYIDIDDNQSISNALSTFSAHITNINNILKSADEDSLILIDELISGTDPKEAQAISLAILERILELRSKFVITTHYDDIKQFAYNNEKILLSSVGFDLEKLRPTYRYLENSVGVSNAIDIASRYFDDQGIITKAREYLDINKTREDELLDKLSKEISENEALKESLNEEIVKNETLNDELTKEKEAFEKEKSTLYEKYKNELNEYIDEIKDKAREKLDQLADVKEEKTFIKEVEELKIEAPEPEEVTFEVGDNVKVGESSQSGEITEINGNNVSVNINGLIVKTKLDNLIKLPKKVKKEYKPRQRMQRVSSEINLVGERVEEALVLLDNYLDNAYGSGLKTVKIIHGFGTGQLRNGIRAHLKKSKIVAEFGNGDTYDGGSNVTRVKFR